MHSAQAGWHSKFINCFRNVITRLSVNVRKSITHHFVNFRKTDKYIYLFIDNSTPVYSNSLSNRLWKSSYNKQLVTMPHHRMYQFIFRRNKFCLVLMLLFLGILYKSSKLIHAMVWHSDELFVIRAFPQPV
jgi:hypothetical protein